MNTTAPKQPEAFSEAQRFQQYLLTQGIAIAPSKPHLPSTLNKKHSAQ